MANLPCLRLARYAAEEGGSAPAILNAANEVSVDAFLNRKIAFTQIADVIETVFNQLSIKKIETIDDVLQIDNEARAVANKALKSLRFN